MGNFGHVLIFERIVKFQFSMCTYDADHSDWQTKILPMSAISPHIMPPKSSTIWEYRQLLAIRIFATYLQVEFQIPAVIASDSPHKDSICRIANFNDGAMVTCSSVRIKALSSHRTWNNKIPHMVFTYLPIIGWYYLFLVSQAGTEAHKKGNWLKGK